MQTVVLTPPAFDSANPEAQTNAAKAEAAVKAINDAVTAKQRFLDELVTEHFGGVDNLQRALIQMGNHDGRHLSQIREDAAAVVAEYRALDKAHSDAGQALHDAFTGGK